MRALAIALLVACGQSDEPPPNECLDCDFQVRAIVRWAFYPNVGKDASGCPPDVASIEVLLDTGEAQQFPCSASFGEMTVPNRATRTFARTLDATGNVLSATVPRFLPSDFRVTVAFYGDGGFVRVFVPRGNCMSTTPISMSVTPVPAPAGPRVFKTFFCTEDQDAREGVLLSDPAPAGTYDLYVKGQDIEHTRNGLVVGTNNAVVDVDFTSP